MLAYLLRRMLLLIPTLFGVTVVVFLFLALSPGGLGNIRAREKGMQSAGVDVRRGIERDKRYYGLDQPLPAQYGRWINNISPAGFRMSNRLRWSEADAAAVDAVLAAAPMEGRSDEPLRARQAALDIAGYLGIEPAEAARRLAAAMDEAVAADLPACPPPAGAPPMAVGVSADDRSLAAALFRAMKVDPYKWEEQKRSLAQVRAAYGPAQVRGKFNQYLTGEIVGRNRVVWSAPALKWPDFGESQASKRQVTALVAEHIPVTLLMNLMALPLVEMMAIWAGVKAARRPGGRFDTVSGMVFLLLWSVPVVVAATLALGYLANPRYFAAFPTQMLHDPELADRMPFLPRFAGGFRRGWLLDTLWHLVLPVACLSYHGFAVVSRVMRGATLEALGSDYIRTARAKGVSEADILWRHAFRNASLPLITMLSGILPAMLVGSFIVEYAFNIRGMGLLMVEAAKNNDANVVLAVTFLVTFLVLFCDVLRDIAYAIADPRVSYA